MTALPSFDKFYQALHRRPPFPWQARLVEEVLANGWPRVLDLPTGVGKTSALDVALYTLAAAPTQLPRRVVLVVDRRIVVDRGGEHARQVAPQARRGALCRRGARGDGRRARVSQPDPSIRSRWLRLVHTG
jgi:CRISPR-associated helicase Cas3